MHRINGQLYIYIYEWTKGGDFHSSKVLQFSWFTRSNSHFAFSIEIYGRIPEYTAYLLFRIIYTHETRGKRMLQAWDTLFVMCVYTFRSMPLSHFLFHHLCIILCRKYVNCDYSISSCVLMFYSMHILLVRLNPMHLAFSHSCSFKTDLIPTQLVTKIGWYVYFVRMRLPLTTKVSTFTSKIKEFQRLHSRFKYAFRMQTAELKYSKTVCYFPLFKRLTCNQRISSTHPLSLSLTDSPISSNAYLYESVLSLNEL